MMFLGSLGIVSGLVLVASMIFAPVGAIVAVAGGITLVVGSTYKLLRRGPQSESYRSRKE